MDDKGKILDTVNSLNEVHAELAFLSYAVSLMWEDDTASGCSYCLMRLGDKVKAIAEHLHKSPCEQAS